MIAYNQHRRSISKTANSFSLLLNTSYAAASANSVLNVTTGALSIGAWVRINDTTNRNVIAFLRSSGGINKLLFEILGNKVSVYNYSTGSFYTPSFTLMPGLNYFATFRFDYSLSGNNLFIYIAQEGDSTLTLLDSYALSSPLTDSGTSTLVDMGYLYSNGQMSNFTLDGWRCFTSSISTSQIEADLYHQTTYSNTPSIAYNFNEDLTNMLLLDVSGNNRNGSIVGTPNRVSSIINFTG